MVNFGEVKEEETEGKNNLKEENDQLMLRLK